MNPSISIVCDATFGAGSENFGTVTGNVTFQDGSANSGTVTGNAVFEGTAEHKAGATINGDATFSATAVNNGTVTGTVTVDNSALTARAATAIANRNLNELSEAEWLTFVSLNNLSLVNTPDSSFPYSYYVISYTQYGEPDAVVDTGGYPFGGPPYPSNISLTLYMDSETGLPVQGPYFVNGCRV